MTTLFLFLGLLLGAWSVGLFLAARYSKKFSRSLPAWLPSVLISNAILYRLDVAPALISLVMAAVGVCAGFFLVSPFSEILLASSFFILAPLPFCLLIQSCQQAQKRGREVLFFNPLRPPTLQDQQLGGTQTLAFYIEDSQWTKISGKNLTDFKYWQRFRVAPGLYVCPCTNEILQEIDSLNLYRYLLQPENQEAIEAFKHTLIEHSRGRKSMRADPLNRKRPRVVADSKPATSLDSTQLVQEPHPQNVSHKLQEPEQKYPQKILGEKVVEETPIDAEASKNKAKKRPLRERLPGLMGRSTAGHQPITQAHTQPHTKKIEAEQEQKALSEASSQASSEAIQSKTQPIQKSHATQSTLSNESLTNALTQSPLSTDPFAEAEEQKALMLAQARAQAQARIASTQQSSARSTQQAQQEKWNDKNWKEPKYNPALEGSYDPIFEPLVGPLEKMKMQMKARQATAERVRQARQHAQQRSSAQQSQQRTQGSEGQQQIRQTKPRATLSTDIQQSTSMPSVARSQRPKPETDGEQSENSSDNA